jgi:Thiol-activated cytolysin beta sandwich domain
MSELVPMYLHIANQSLRDPEMEGFVEDAFLKIVVIGNIPNAVTNPSDRPTKKGDKTTTPIPSGLAETSSFSLLFKHQGAYIAHFYLTWDEPNSPGKSWKKEGATAGSTGLFAPNIPKNATNIRLKIEDETGLISAPRKVIINEVIQPVTACYRVFGTTLSPGWAKCN